MLKNDRIKMSFRNNLRKKFENISETFMVLTFALSLK